MLITRLYIGAKVCYNIHGQRPTRDDGDINPNHKACEKSQRGRKIGRPGKEDGAMVDIPRIKKAHRIPHLDFDT